MLPSMLESMSWSVECGLDFNMAAACMIWPLWQYPHCGTLRASKSFGSGGSPAALSPSMVVMRLPAASRIGVRQLRAASPFRWTVHAPHKPIPQPNFVPVSASSSRRYQSNGMSGSPSKRAGLPFMVSWIIGFASCHCLFGQYTPAVPVPSGAGLQSCGGSPDPPFLPTRHGGFSTVREFSGTHRVRQSLGFPSQAFFAIRIVHHFAFRIQDHGGALVQRISRPPRIAGAGKRRPGRAHVLRRFVPLGPLACVRIVVRVIELEGHLHGVRRLLGIRSEEH